MTGLKSNPVTTHEIININYDEFEADNAASDMNDPYNAPFILQEYEGIYRNGEIEYTVRNCWTDFMRCGLFELANAKKFKFYMYIDKSKRRFEIL